jgi:hypothetical protein
MAETFGWSLEYIEGLSMERLHEYERVKDGRAAGIAERRRRDAFMAGGKKKKGGR